MKIYFMKEEESPELIIYILIKIINNYFLILFYALFCLKKKILRSYMYRWIYLYNCENLYKIRESVDQI